MVNYSVRAQDYITKQHMKNQQSLNSSAVDMDDIEFEVGINEGGGDHNPHEQTLNNAKLARKLNTERARDEDSASPKRSGNPF